MPIVVQRDSKSAQVLPSGFALEKDLKYLLMRCPELLRDDSESESGDTPEIKLVGEEISLEAGDIDLLFVDGSGRLILVETKLNVNEEARREIVAQVIDYLSALTQLTARELDSKVGGKLKKALEDLAGNNEEERTFDTLWGLVETNLRGGRTRVVMALDKVPHSLERIFLFLTQRSELDARLLTIERYAPAAGEEIIVPRYVVRRTETTSPPDTPKELLAVEDAFNKLSPDLKTTGNASNFRMVKVLPKFGCNFEVGKTFLRVYCYYDGDEPSVKELLKSFPGRRVGNGKAALEWTGKEGATRVRLGADFKLDEPSALVAQAMLDLLDLTRKPVTEVLAKLRQEPATSAAGGPSPPPASI